jgi:hypothetical protein
MTTTIFTKIEGVTCCYETCGVLFGLGQEHKRRLKETHNFFYCPNGHEQHFTAKSEAELQRERADRAERNAKFYEDRMKDARADRDSALHKVRAECGAKIKLQKKLKRVANGVCPDCSRSFRNLARHMATKHPEHVKK